MFFTQEKISSRQTSVGNGFAHQIHPQLFSRNFSLGNDSGFDRSPYEIFRDNVADFCDRFMGSSFDSLDCMTSEEKATEAFFRNHGSCHVESCPFQEESRDLRCLYDPSSTGEFIMETAPPPTSWSDEPVSLTEDVQKSPLLKKITRLMNNYSPNLIRPFAGQPTLKLPLNPNKWNACECYVHNGKHNNCCQCQEPYHRTSCGCTQHSASHSYCCRCDVHLLQEYDDYLKKKRVLKLSADQGAISDGGQGAWFNFTPERHMSRRKAIDTKRFTFPKLRDSSPEKYSLDKPGTSIDQSTYDERQNTQHPCESCCKKLDDIYGSALREVHSMLVDVSRSLLPPGRRGSNPSETLVRDSRGQAQDQSVTRANATYEDQGPEWSPRFSDEVSAATRESNQSDAAIQVNTYTTWEEGSKRKRLKLFSKGKLKKKCVIS